MLVLAMGRSRDGAMPSRKPGRMTSASEQFPVTMAAGKHPFPSRTRKLRPSAPMVLGGRPPGRVGRRRIFWKRKSPRTRGLLSRPGFGNLPVSSDHPR